jgi:hypothetical protein
MSIQTNVPFNACDSQPPSWWHHRNRFQTAADEIPALAGTLLQLELLLNAPMVDLEAVTRLVRSDLGLCIQVLKESRFGAADGDQLWRISDCVIQLGSQLLGLARPLCCGVEQRKFAYAEAEAFWKHASLVASVAEQTATYFYELGVNPEQAYLAGLMHNLHKLPDVLAFVDSEGATGSLRADNDWVMDCNLPFFIHNVLESRDDGYLPTELSPLLRVISFSKRWIDLCLPWSETCMARRNRFKFPVLKAVNLIYTHFPGTDVDPLTPFMEIVKDCIFDQLQSKSQETLL